MMVNYLNYKQSQDVENTCRPFFWATTMVTSQKNIDIFDNKCTKIWGYHRKEQYEGVWM